MRRQSQADVSQEPQEARKTLTDRFPAIVDAARRLKTASVLIDGEAVIIGDDGTPDFHALRSKRRAGDALLFAFDLLELRGDDLPLIERKRRLLQLIGKAQ